MADDKGLSRTPKHEKPAQSLRKRRRELRIDYHSTAVAAVYDQSCPK